MEKKCVNSDLGELSFLQCKQQTFRECSAKETVEKLFFSLRDTDCREKKVFFISPKGTHLLKNKRKRQFYQTSELNRAILKTEQY